MTEYFIYEKENKNFALPVTSVLEIVETGYEKGFWVLQNKNEGVELNNEEVKKNLIEILTAKSVIEKNQEIQKNIIFKKSKQLQLEEMKKIAKDLNITINATSINNINDKNAFKEEGILSQIYSMNENDIAIVSSKDYKKNYWTTRSKFIKRN